MSRPRRIDKDAPSLVQWVIDAEPAEMTHMAAGTSILVEISGLTGDKVVNLRGGLTNGANHLLAAFRRDGLESIPPVRFVRPETDADGVTVTIVGIA